MNLSFHNIAALYFTGLILLLTFLVWLENDINEGKQS